MSRDRALTRIPFVDALVAFGGPAPNALLAACTVRRGKPVAVVWAGSDVLDIRGAPEEIARVRARRFRHAACSAALAQELCDLGIAATELRLVVAESHSPLAPLPARFSVLAYCPDSRRDVYGVDIMHELMRRLPQAHFDIIGGYRDDLRVSNATYHGWVDDPGPMIDATTVVVRPTRHDGMPLIVLEALARGRHVVWSQALEGVFHARNTEEIVTYIAALQVAHDQGRLHFNEDGLKAIETSFSPAAVTRGVEDFLDDLVAESESRRRRISSDRRRAVVSGDPSSVAAFVEQAAKQDSRWDIHPLIGRSRSERLDDSLAMTAAERWFALDEHSVDPLIARVARVMRKKPLLVKFEPDKPLNGALHVRRRGSSITLTSKEWLAFDASRPAPTFFARPAWAMALEKSFNGVVAEPTLFRLPQGEALLPLMRSGRQLGSVEAMPLGTYTVPLSPDGEPADAELAQAIVQRIAERGFADFSCTLWPLGDYASVNGCERASHQTSVIDLRDGAEAALAGFKGVARRMVGQARRKGVTCSPEAGAVDVYYGLLEETAKRWGKEAPHLPRRIFEALVEFGGDNVEIWIARYKGEAIAGGVLLYGAREVFFWSAAMRAEYGDLRPSNLLNAEMIKAAADRGIAWYNLGASEGLDGVSRFKESLGAQLIDYTTLSGSSALRRTYRRLRSALRR